MKKPFLAALFTLASLSSTHATIVGDQIMIEFWLGSPGDTFAEQTVIVPGTWNPNDDVPGSGVNEVSVADGFITIIHDGGGWFGAEFNGFHFTNLNPITEFTSFSLLNVSSNAPLIAPVATFTSNSLEINFTPTGDANSATDGGLADVHYTFAFTYGPGSAVPESSTTAALAGLAAGLVVVLRRMRRGK